MCTPTQAKEDSCPLSHFGSAKCSRCMAPSPLACAGGGRGVQSSCSVAQVRPPAHFFEGERTALFTGLSVLEVLRGSSSAPLALSERRVGVGLAHTGSPKFGHALRAPMGWGGAAFVGLPASVVWAALKRQALTQAEPKPKAARALIRQGYTELERDIDSGAASGVPALSSRTSTQDEGGGATAETMGPPESQLVVATPSGIVLGVVPRVDMPVVRPFARASREISLQVSLSESWREEAVARLELDMLANSSRNSVESKLKLFREFHEAWFGEVPFWIPVTPSSVIAVGAMLKAGNYSSGANYISAARVHSRDKGHPEHPLLAHTVRKVVISIERGVGQQKQTSALPLDRFEELPDGDEPWAKGGPVGTADALTTGSWWLMRELEMASLNVADVVINVQLLRVELRLSCSKNDSKAIGKGRTHGCSCRDEAPVKYCPYHTVMRQKERLLRMFPEVEVLADQFPFFPTVEGERMQKHAFQQCVEIGATMLGLPTRGPRGEVFYTGHVCRRTGAEAFTAAGIEVSVTQIFGRWGKNTILRYCQEAPSGRVGGLRGQDGPPDRRGSGGRLRRGAAGAARHGAAPGGEAEAAVEQRAPALGAHHLGARGRQRHGGAPAAGAADAQGGELGARQARGGPPGHQGRGARGPRLRTGDRAPPLPLWKTRCGWRLGRKHPSKWRLLEENEDLLPFVVCDRCAGSNAG